MVEDEILDPEGITGAVGSRPIPESTHRDRKDVIEGSWYPPPYSRSLLSIKGASLGTFSS